LSGLVMTGEEKGSDPGPVKRTRKGSRKQDWIANQLRRVYDEAVQEDIPAEMMALLARLDEPEKEGGA
jgi:hypothetical protein